MATVSSEVVFRVLVTAAVIEGLDSRVTLVAGELVLAVLLVGL